MFFKDIIIAQDGLLFRKRFRSRAAALNLEAAFASLLDFSQFCWESSPAGATKKAQQGLFLVTEMLKHFHEVVADHLGVSAFDVVTLDEVD